jgi:hypothetical protein
MYEGIGMKCLGTFIFCDSGLDELANEHIVCKWWDGGVAL